MAKSDYIRTADQAFSAQLQTFKNAIGSYATLLDVSAADISAQAADADYFAYVLAAQQLMHNGSRQWTSWKILQREGGDPPPTGAPVPPTFPTAVPPVAPGIEPRFRSLVKRIKAHPSYNAAMGAALGIEGSEQSGPDLTTIQPNIRAEVSGTYVLVEWGWGGHSEALDMCEIEVDRGQGFVLLAMDTTPRYVDTTPFPAAPTKWTYRAIYRVGDQRVGQWSKPVSVTVGG